MKDGQTNQLRFISPKSRLFFCLICMSIIVYTKISNVQVLNNDINKFDASIRDITHSFSKHPNQAPRNQCQIIYILGVEGAIHHGFTPILHSLALHQIDSTGQPHDVQLQPRALRSALFGRFREKRPLNDASLIRDTLTDLCPNDGKRHVIIEDSSFPCGQEGDPRGYRYPRQSEWRNMTMSQIVESEVAINHPVNLYQFVELYGRYAQIRFVVLHRPFLDTVASHMDWDGGWEGHSHLIMGFMMLLRRFLDERGVDDVSGGNLWTIVCVERLMSKFYQYQGEHGSQVDYEEWDLGRRLFCRIWQIFLDGLRESVTIALLRGERVLATRSACLRVIKLCLCWIT
ncbi:hypothetical protein ACHAWX_003587 [Stephanocyclus meneghinianus]